MPNPQNSLSYAISSVTIYRNHCLPLKKKTTIFSILHCLPQPLATWLLYDFLLISSTLR